MSIRYVVIAFIFVISGIAIKGDSIQTIDVLNNSARALNFSAKNVDGSLSIAQVVPAFAKSFVLVQVTQLKSLQDMLYEGIINNSPQEIRQAIRAGANINLEKEGKRPLFWAITFHRTDAIRCLLEQGAF